MNSIHPILLQKMKEQRIKYVKVTEFANTLPLFASTIIDNEYTGEQYTRLAERFGKLPLNWGVCWFVGIPINYPYETGKPPGLVNVYINCSSLFGDTCGDLGYKTFHEVVPTIKVHFYDSWNSTFYFLPEEVEDGLKILEKWYVETSAKTNEYLKQKRKEELERELAKLS